MADTDEPQPVCLTVECSDVHECIDVLTILCEDLESELRDRHRPDNAHPTQIRRFNNDMDPVNRGRFLIEKLTQHGALTNGRQQQ